MNLTVSNDSVLTLSYSDRRLLGRSGTLTLNLCTCREEEWSREKIENWLKTNSFDQESICYIKKWLDILLFDDGDKQDL